MSSTRGLEGLSSAQPLTIILAIAVIFCFPLSGCSKDADNGSTNQSLGDRDVIATVNGAPIDRDQMYSEMEQYVPSQLQGFPSNQMLQYTAGRVALQQLITNQLLLQLATISHVPVTNDEITARYNDVKMVKEAQSTSSFEDLLSNQGISTQQFDNSTIMPDVARYNLLTRGLTVTDDELQQYYNAHIADFTLPDRVHIERIIVRDQATANQAYADASKSNSLEGEMGQNIGAPFSGGDNEADIPQWINIDTPPAPLKHVAVAAAAAQPGTILKPLQVAGQWWLVDLVDRKSRAVLPYSQVQHIVQWNVETNKANALGNFQKVQQEMFEITQQALINVKPPQYVSLVRQLKNPPLTSPISGSTQQPGP